MPAKVSDAKEKIFKEELDGLIKSFNYRFVGWIVSRNGRSQENAPTLWLTGEELLKACELQAKFGEHFVTVVMTVDVAENVACDAFQVSNKCIEFYKKKLMQVHATKPDHIQFNQKVKCFDEMADEIETKYLLIPVGIKNHTNGYLQSGFPLRNRPEAFNPDYRQSVERAKMVIASRIKGENQSFVSAIGDFHLLLFLLEMKILKVKLDFPALSKGIMKKDPKSTMAVEASIRGSLGL